MAIDEMEPATGPVLLAAARSASVMVDVLPPSVRLSRGSHTLTIADAAGAID
nr:uncharacterized protein CTRU02_00070 [Colletotrichum truncatum]KAF6801321.1 hypothetical protein CTRU02_00070 [Colletotrichum truncatum]